MVFCIENHWSVRDRCHELHTGVSWSVTVRQEEDRDFLVANDLVEYGVRGVRAVTIRVDFVQVLGE